MILSNYFCRLLSVLEITNQVCPMAKCTEKLAHQGCNLLISDFFYSKYFTLLMLQGAVTKQ